MQKVWISLNKGLPLVLVSSKERCGLVSYYDGYFTLVPLSHVLHLCVGSDDSAISKQ